MVCTGISGRCVNLNTCSKARDLGNTPSDDVSDLSANPLHLPKCNRPIILFIGCVYHHTSGFQTTFRVIFADDKRKAVLIRGLLKRLSFVFTRFDSGY